MGFPFHGRVIIFLKQVRYSDIYLGGGNSNIFYVHPDPWGNDPICLIYFSNGLGKNHPTSYPFLGFEIPFQEVVVVTIASSEGRTSHPSLHPWSWTLRKIFLWKMKFGCKTLFFLWRGDGHWNWHVTYFSDVFFFCVGLNSFSRFLNIFHVSSCVARGRWGRMGLMVGVIQQVVAIHHELLEISFTQGNGRGLNVPGLHTIPAFPANMWYWNPHQTLRMGYFDWKPYETQWTRNATCFLAMFCLWVRISSRAILSIFSLTPSHIAPHSDTNVEYSIHEKGWERFVAYYMQRTSTSIQLTLTGSSLETRN